VTEKELELGPTKYYILQALKLNIERGVDLSLGDFAYDIGMSYKTVIGAVNELIDDGVVEHEVKADSSKRIRVVGITDSGTWKLRERKKARRYM
jgi:DNA-binding MarR family transcriptional regulator